ncbi:hypothetical protein A2U01_0107360, partial [Trifolium medium]|nr:hypothetical protein [Trifolium medium]
DPEGGDRESVVDRGMDFAASLGAIITSELFSSSDVLGDEE